MVYYSQTEFELEPVLERSGRGLEIGRIGVTPDTRHGTMVAVPWSGIARLVRAKDHGHRISFASLDARDGGSRARALYAALESRHRSTGTIVPPARIDHGGRRPGRHAPPAATANPIRGWAPRWPVIPVGAPHFA